MAKSELFNISKFSNGLGIDFELIDAQANSNILIFGCIENFFGEFMAISNNNYIRSLFSKSAAAHNYKWLINALHNNCKITVIEIVEDINEISYYDKIKINLKNNYDTNFDNKFTNIKVVNNCNTIYTEFFNIINDMPKFDYIIQNPPYTLNKDSHTDNEVHLTFAEKCYNLLVDTGKMVIIQPATWLINIKKNNKHKNLIKIFNNHIHSINIDNFNKAFNINTRLNLSITYIDKSTVYNNINYTYFGVNTIINNVYDANLIGNYELIWSIFNKVSAYGNMMKQHITNKNISGETYLPYKEDMSLNGYNSAVDYISTKNGEYYGTYVTQCIHKKYNMPSNTIPTYTYRQHLKNENCIYGTYEELMNWIYFIKNNKLPLFINMCITTHKDNKSKPYIPWLVDKQYTDEDINKLFGFAEDEINLIDKTIKKFERHSPWFKRYMCGPDSVSNEEVQNFIDSL